MLTALHLALEDTFAPEQRRAIGVSAALAALFLTLLWLGIGLLLAHTRVAGIWWLDTLIDVAGSAAALLLAWMLFPVVTLLVLGFFLDGVIASVESRRYPGLGPIRRCGIAGGLAGTLRLLALTVLLNLVILPLCLVPPINLFIYYLLNGYLIGREYFEVVALRRVDEGVARAMWRRHRGRLVLAGMVVVFLLSLPLVNLVAPVMAVAFMLHVFEGFKRGEMAETFAGSR